MLFGGVLWVCFGASEDRTTLYMSNDEDRGAKVVHMCYIGRDIRKIEIVN